jgi:carbon starvation protein
LFTLTGPTLAILIIIYGFAASALPVWLLLAPRDYLSTFVKLGTIALLALGIVALRPTLHMPALTRFVDGSGPVFAGSIFPFAFITIACGAISGFHSLIASGTTPKLIRRESEARIVGYGAMLAESTVAILRAPAGNLFREQQSGGRGGPSSRSSGGDHYGMGISSNRGRDAFTSTGGG